MPAPTETRPKLPATVYAESTPNPATMKFVANRILVPGPAVEFRNASEAGPSQLAATLFTFPFVKNVFISGNFVTVTKTDGVDWNDIVLEIREFVRDYLSAGKPVLAGDLTGVAAAAAAAGAGPAAAPEPSTETEQRIVQVLEEYIRPAVEQDGGAITFHSFEKGVVKVHLRGACSGCPSSTVTLKAGIEGLLKRMVPGVESVEAEGV